MFIENVGGKKRKRKQVFIIKEGILGKDHRMRNDIKTQERLLCLEKCKAFRVAGVLMARLQGGGNTGRGRLERAKKSQVMKGPHATTQSDFIENGEKQRQRTKQSGVHFRRLADSGLEGRSENGRPGRRRLLQLSE